MKRHFAIDVPYYGKGVAFFAVTSNLACIAAHQLATTTKPSYVADWSVICLRGTVKASSLGGLAATFSTLAYHGTPSAMATGLLHPTIYSTVRIARCPATLHEPEHSSEGPRE